VRLKDPIVISAAFFSISFQFLLVRLKVTPRVQELQPSAISIPFGAIKRPYHGTNGLVG